MNEIKKKERIEKLKEFILELCCVYTFVSVTGAIVNIIAGTETNKQAELIREIQSRE